MDPPAQRQKVVVMVVQGFWQFTLFQPGTFCEPKTACCCTFYSFTSQMCTHSSDIDTYATLFCFSLWGHDGK